MNSIHFPGAFLDQAFAVTDQFFQFSLFTVLDEAAFKEAVKEQVGDPLGILDIGLASGNSFDVLCVDHQDIIKVVMLQDVPLKD